MNQPQRHGDTEFAHINNLTERIIGAAMEVHRALGPGLLEGLYETALCIELDERGIKYARQVKSPRTIKADRSVHTPWTLSSKILSSSK